MEVIKLFYLKGINKIPYTIDQPKKHRDHVDPNPFRGFSIDGGIDIVIHQGSNGKSEGIGEIIYPYNLIHIPGINHMDLKNDQR